MIERAFAGQLRTLALCALTACASGQRHTASVDDGDGPFDPLTGQGRCDGSRIAIVDNHTTVDLTIHAVLPSGSTPMGTSMAGRHDELVIPRGTQHVTYSAIAVAGSVAPSGVDIRYACRP